MASLIQKTMIKMKNRISIFSTLLLVMLFSLATFANDESAESLREKETQAKELAQEILTGRQAMVRVYNNWQSDPLTYELLSIPLNGLVVSLDDVKEAIGEMYPFAVIVVTAEDQTDETVAAVVGNFIYAEYYEKGKNLFIWPISITNKPGDLCTVKDALGNPIPNAKVQIFISSAGISSARPRVSGIWLRDTTLDAKGRIKPISTTSKYYWRLDTLVSHPDYGTAFAVPYGQPVEYYVVPLVRIGPETITRSLWGTVVDPNRNPISGTRIICSAVLAPGGVGTNTFPGTWHRTLTDKQGRFSLTVPIGEGKLALPNSKYYIYIDPPKNPDRAYSYGEVPSGKECTIVYWDQDTYFHTFAFEDANGPIIDPDRLNKIRIDIVQKDKKIIYLQYSRWKDGGMFPVGTYKLAMRENRPIAFGPIEVTADSPVELVFKPSKGLVYSGQIINGVTGRPIQGAVMMIGDFMRQTEDFSTVTDEQWQAIHSLPIYPPLDEPALQPLTKFCRSKIIVKADQQGRFVISTLTGEKLYDVVVVEENYIPYVHAWRGYGPRQTESLKPDENKLFQMPPFKLYPAAKIVFEPYIEENDDTARVQARQTIERGDNIAWLDDFSSSWYRSNRKFRPNRRVSMHVPSGLNVRIKLLLFSSRYGNDYWLPITLPNTSNLAPGQTLDLGRQEFERKPAEFLFYLKLVNSTGQLIEGVGVFCVLDDKRFRSYNCTTNEEGIAEFSLPLYSKGKFGVAFDEDGLKLLETIAYEVAGKEDEGKQFTLQISDEMLYQLFK